MVGYTKCCVAYCLVDLPGAHGITGTKREVEPLIEQLINQHSHHTIITCLLNQDQVSHRKWLVECLERNGFVHHRAARPRHKRGPNGMIEERRPRVGPPMYPGQSAEYTTYLMEDEGWGTNPMHVFIRTYKMPGEQANAAA